MRESGAYLYSQQDIESPRLATLQREERLTLLAEAVGNQTWYLARTRQGLTGWVRGSDVIASEGAKKTFAEEPPFISTWRAQANDGTLYEGTWTVQPERSAKSLSGAWIMNDASGNPILTGTWSAEKFSTGWNGVWRAQVDGQKQVYAGSWSTDVPHAPEMRFSDLIEAAARNEIRGIWTGGDQSGTWAIRAAK